LAGEADLFIFEPPGKLEKLEKLGELGG